MAAALYDVALQKIVDGTIDLDTDDIRALLIRTSGGGAGPYYTFSAAHDFLDDVPNNTDCRPETAVALTTKTALSGGYLDCDNITWPSVGAGDAIQAIIYYVHTGVDATSRLVAYDDASTGLPITPDGNNITLTVNASGLLKI